MDHPLLSLISELYAGTTMLREQLNTVTAERDALLAELEQRQASTPEDIK